MSPPRRVDLAVLHGDETRRLVAELAASRLVCFPTDTVYGLGGRLTPAVHAALSAAKGREPGKPFQVIYPSLDVLEASLALEARLRDAARRLLPGPFTLVIPYPAELEFPPPGAVPCGDAAAAGAARATTPTLGIRVPEWPRAARVLAHLPYPLLASSANPSGQAPPRALDEVDADLLASCDLALDAGPVAGVASTVLDLSSFALDGGWRILRRGGVDEAGVAARLGSLVEERHWS